MGNMKAVIVAAGMSSRLRPITNNTPKCLLRIDEHPIIDYSVRILNSLGISEIAIVVGFLKDKFPAMLGDKYEYIFNPFYASTNNMASLWFAKDFVKDSDFLYLHSDLLYHPDIPSMLLATDSDIALAVEETVCDVEMMKVMVDGLDLLESSKNVPIDKAFGEWTGIAKFTKEGWKKYLVEVEQLLSAREFNAYDTLAMNHLVQKERIIQIVPFKNLPFVEIDEHNDLQQAKEVVMPALKNILMNI